MLHHSHSTSERTWRTCQPLVNCRYINYSEYRPSYSISFKHTESPVSSAHRSGSLKSWFTLPVPPAVRRQPSTRSRFNGSAALRPHYEFPPFIKPSSLQAENQSDSPARHDGDSQSLVGDNALSERSSPRAPAAACIIPRPSPHLHRSRAPASAPRLRWIQRNLQVDSLWQQGNTSLGAFRGPQPDRHLLPEMDEHKREWKDMGLEAPLS